METRQATLLDLNKQMEEMKKIQAQLVSEMQKNQAEGQQRLATEIRSEISGELADLKTMMNKCLTSFPHLLSGHQETSQLSSATMSANPHTPPHPKPPDLHDLAHASSGKAPVDTDRSSLPQNGMMTHLSKVGFPTFDGTMLRDWLYRCGQFFMLDNTAPDLKVKLASIHLEGNPNRFYIERSFLVGVITIICLSFDAFGTRVFYCIPLPLMYLLICIRSIIQREREQQHLR